MNAITRFLLSGLAVFAIPYILPGVHVENYGYALLVAFVLAVVNFIVKPVLILFTIPITILTLGLFLLVINALMLKVAAAFVPGFRIDGFLPAFLGAIVLSLVNMALRYMLGA